MLFKGLDHCSGCFIYYPYHYQASSSFSSSSIIIIIIHTRHKEPILLHELHYDLKRA